MFLMQELSHLRMATRPSFSGSQVIHMRSSCTIPVQFIAPIPRKQLRNARSPRSRAQIRCAAAAKQMLVYVPPHPLIKHWVAVMRNKDTPGAIFRAAAAELGRILVYEAVREWLPVIEGEVETPLGATADVTFVDPTQPIKLVPILRAGLILLESAATVLPATETYHIGYVRDDATLEARCYLNKLPDKLTAADRVLITDPMMATGGTMMHVVEEITSRGADPSNIRIVCVVAAPPALSKLNAKYPGVVVYAGMLDAEVNERGYIVPGLGDAGDRAFGTPTRL